MARFFFIRQNVKFQPSCKICFKFFEFAHLGPILRVEKKWENAISQFNSNVFPYFISQQNQILFIHRNQVTA